MNNVDEEQREPLNQGPHFDNPPHDGDEEDGDSDNEDVNMNDIRDDILKPASTRSKIVVTLKVPDEVKSQ